MDAKNTMNTQKIKLVEKCLKALPNHMVRNLMEHAANKTPTILGNRNGDVNYDFINGNAG